MTRNEEEVFFSLDVEADGPIPVKNSMLSFGCVAFSGFGAVLGKFERNLTPLPGAVQDPKTMTEFWAREKEAWDYCTTNTVSPEQAMKEFVAWVKSIPGQRVAVCMPAGFDWTYIYMYLMMFADESPFSFSCIDMKTYVAAMQKQPYRESGKKSWARRWFDNDLPHTHKAIDDALEQGYTFTQMRAQNLNTAGPSGPLSHASIYSNFWNSLGGKPGFIAEYSNGHGKIKTGFQIHKFGKKILFWENSPPDSWEPEIGTKVRVLFQDGNPSRVFVL